MGSRVNVCSVNFLENPSTFTADFKLEITFEVFELLPGDLEWQLVYVGSGESSNYDQELDTVLVGPTPEGKHKFVFSAKAPDASKIPQADIVGVSVLLLKLKYNEKEFLNLGWFVSNEYEDETLKENPPSNPIIDKLQRTVKTDDIRVTSYPIRWSDNDTEEVPPVEPEEPVDEADLMPLEDNEPDNEEEEEDEAVDGDVDLEATMEKDEAMAGNGDNNVEEMDAEENKDSETTVTDSKAAESIADEAPLGDKTNDTA